HLHQMMADYSGWHFAHRDPEPARDPPTRARLGEIAVPTLVIVGARDLPDYQDIAAILAAAIPHARLAALPGAGHMSNMEAPPPTVDPARQAGRAPRRLASLRPPPPCRPPAGPTSLPMNPAARPCPAQGPGPPSRER